jgi:hypothetical protein
MDREQSPSTALQPPPRDYRGAAKRVGIVLRLPLVAGVILSLAITLIAMPQISLAGPLHKPKAAKAPLPPPPPTVLPPLGFPPPAVYGFPETSYRSGWYNTHYWPRKDYHHGFYGDYWQWGYFPGY